VSFDVTPAGLTPVARNHAELIAEDLLRFSKAVSNPTQTCSAVAPPGRLPASR